VALRGGGGPLRVTPSEGVTPKCKKCQSEEIWRDK